MRYMRPHSDHQISVRETHLPAMGETSGETRDGQAGDKVLEHLYKVLVIGDFGVGTPAALGSRIVRFPCGSGGACYLQSEPSTPRHCVSGRAADVVLFVSNSLL